MSERKTPSKALSVQELRSLIGLHFDFVRATQRKLQERVGKALGAPATENDESSSLMARLCEFAADVIARRLKRNRRTVPLFAEKDIARFIPTMLDLLEGQRVATRWLEVEVTRIYGPPGRRQRDRAVLARRRGATSKSR